MTWGDDSSGPPAALTTPRGSGGPVSPPVKVGAAKAEMRTRATQARSALWKTFPNPEDVGTLLRRSFLAHYPLPPHATVAGYWPADDEMDVRPLLHHLAEQGHTVAMPVVMNKEQPLRFRRWSPGLQMVPGRFGIPMPPDTLPEVTPDLVLTPLLAFDRDGYRLGRGAGYYDRTLQSLRARGYVTAVGVAFAGQEVPAVPHDIRDQKLDWIVTELHALPIGHRDNPFNAFGALS